MKQAQRKSTISQPKNSMNMINKSKERQQRINKDATTRQNTKSVGKKSETDAKVSETNKKAECKPRAPTKIPKYDPERMSPEYLRRRLAQHKEMEKKVPSKLKQPTKVKGIHKPTKIPRYHTRRNRAADDSNRSQNRPRISSKYPSRLRMPKKIVLKCLQVKNVECAADTPQSDADTQQECADEENEIPSADDLPIAPNSTDDISSNSIPIDICENEMKCASEPRENVNNGSENGVPMGKVPINSNFLKLLKQSGRRLPKAKPVQIGMTKEQKFHSEMRFTASVISDAMKLNADFAQMEADSHWKDQFLMKQDQYIACMTI